MRSSSEGAREATPRKSEGEINMDDVRTQIRFSKRPLGCLIWVSTGPVLIFVIPT